MPNEPTESDADKLRNVDQVWGQWEGPYKQKEALGPIPLMQQLKKAEPKRLAAVCLSTCLRTENKEMKTTPGCGPCFFNDMEVAFQYVCLCRLGVMTVQTGQQ